MFRKYKPPPPGPEAPTDTEIDNRVVQTAIGKDTMPKEAEKRQQELDDGRLLTDKSAPPRPNVDEYIDSEFDFSTDLMAASRYMPAFRRAARAIVRFREKLNEARLRVAAVSHCVLLRSTTLWSVLLAVFVLQARTHLKASLPM